MCDTKNTTFKFSKRIFHVNEIMIMAKTDSKKLNKIFYLNIDWATKFERLLIDSASADHFTKQRSLIRCNFSRAVHFHWTQFRNY